MDDYEKMVATVEKVFELTKSGKLEWKPDPNDADAPWVKIGEQFIVLREGRNPSGSIIYKFSIEDSNERVIDVFSDEDLDRDGSNGSYFELFQKLFLLARRRASGADKALDQILKGLDGLA